MSSLALAQPMLPAATRQYPKGLRPRCRPYGANAFDDCLESEYNWWMQFLASGGLKACCPQGRKKYTSPPWISPPAEARRFRPITSTSIATFVAGVDTVVLQERIPLGYDGVINDVVFSYLGGAGFVEGSGDITWRLAADYLPVGAVTTGGRYLRDMGNVITSLGSLTQPSPVPRGGLRVYSYDLVTIYCNIAVGAPIAGGNIIVSIGGHVWPR